MSDSARRYRAVLKALKKMFPEEPKGNLLRRLNVLAALISGIVGSKSTNLPAIAGEAPFDIEEDSSVKRFERWLQNEHIKMESYFLPFAQALIASLAHLPLVLVIDGSIVGRGCITLVVGLVYKQRALPIAWIVVKGKKGHLPEELHIELIERVRPLIPQEAQVRVIGDGEFDGIGFQATLNGWGWKYALRTAKNIILQWQGQEFSFQDMGDYIQPGEDLVVPGALFTKEQYGPVLAIAWWRKDCKEPIYLVSNMQSEQEAYHFYSKRFRIETFFSDQKSRGFHLDKSHISDPERLSRLMIGACLAYHWIIFLGVTALEKGWKGTIHRKHRCDLSLFQLGLRLLKRLLRKCLPIPVVFGRVRE
jgi:hypothetical protein